MVLKLMEIAQKRWHRLRGYNLLADVITEVKFCDGIKQKQQGQDAAEKLCTPSLTIARN